MIQNTSLNDELTEPVLADIVHKNIKTMLQLRQQAEQRRGYRYIIANQITQYVGSFAFTMIQISFLILWISINSSWMPVQWRFDQFPYALLSTILTVEAILIAIFILMNQNHLKDLAQKSEDLNVQISLLTEHEVTQIISMVEKIYDHLNIIGSNKDISDLKLEMSPEKVLQVIEKETVKMAKTSPAMIPGTAEKDL